MPLMLPPCLGPVRAWVVVPYARLFSWSTALLQVCNFVQEPLPGSNKGRLASAIVVDATEQVNVHRHPKSVVPSALPN